MAFVGSLFSGDKGLGYEVNKTPAMKTISEQQLGQLYGQQQASQAQQQAFVGALSGMNAQTFQQQQQLASQLAAQAQGQGPNIAAAQLAQATGQNVARQAALMSSQRGAGQSAGTIARLAGIQGAETQQQAAGQAAILRANQQLAAQQALGQMTGQMIGQQQAAQAVQGQLAQQGLAAGYGAAGQYNITAANLSAQQAELEKQRASQQYDIFKGVTNAVGQAAMMFLADGGMVPKREISGGSIFDSYVENMADGGQVPGKAQVAGDSYKNDKVPAMLSPGEIVIPRSVLNGRDPVKGASEFVAAVLAKKGGKK